jgi:glutathione S-transferase
MEARMVTARPQLITFAASHFCEKARWALDWHGISYDEVGWPPGLHRILAKRRGLKEAKVPILFDGEDVVQGTVAIVDWADRKGQNQDRTLTPKDGRSEVSEIENRAGDLIGVHVRRLAFADEAQADDLDQRLHEKMIKAATRLSVLVAARACGPIRIGFRNPVLFVALLAQPVIDGWMGTSARAMAVRCRLTLTILLCHCCHS